MYIKGEVNTNIVIIRNFNTSLTTMDRSSGQKIKEIVALKNTLNQMDLIDVFRELHPKVAEYIHLSITHKYFLG